SSRLDLWDTTTGKRVASLAGETRDVYGPGVGGGVGPAALRGHGGDVRALAFSADGRTLASGGADRTVRLWRVKDGAELGTLRGRGWGSASRCVGWRWAATGPRWPSPPAMRCGCGTGGRAGRWRRGGSRATCAGRRRALSPREPLLAVASLEGPVVLLGRKAD